ncbi:hypothetical protein BH23CHL8_BH23CHL8_29870 [soil metagenome]
MKGILAAGTEHEGTPPVSGTTAPAHLRGRQGLFEDLDAGEEAVG